MKKYSFEKKIIRYKIIEMHMECVRKSMYREARMLLNLLRRGNLTVGLDDVSFTVENMLESIGIKPRYGRNFNTACFKI